MAAGVVRAKASAVARRLVLEGRVRDWRVRSGRRRVSKVARTEVGDEARTTSAERAAWRTWSTLR